MKTEHSKLTTLKNLTFGAMVSLSAPAFSADMEQQEAPGRNALAQIQGVQATWWEAYANQPGFTEALTDIGYGMETLRQDQDKAQQDSLDGRTALHWLKRSMEMYPPDRPNEYHMPVAHIETPDWGDGRYATLGRGILFFTRTMGAAGDVVRIETGAVPEGTQCYAATGRDFKNKDRSYLDQESLQANGVTTYKFKQDGVLMLGCGDPEQQRDGQRVKLNVSGGHKSNLFILGQNTQSDWEESRHHTGDFGFALMFDGRTNTVVPGAIARWTGETISQVLGSNLQVKSLFEKMNGMDSSSPLFIPSQGSQLANYGTCCFADYRQGYTGVGFYQWRMNSPGGTNDWGLWHEFGHIYEPFREYMAMLTEGQVNLYSIEACRMKNGNKDIPLGQCHPQLKSFPSWDPQAVRNFLASTESYDKFPGNPWVKLRFQANLRFAYGEDFFARVNQIRLKAVHAAPGPTMGKRYTQVLGNTQRVTDFLVVAYSTVAGHDLRNYFSRWGLKFSDEASKKVAVLKLPEPNEVAHDRLPIADAGEDWKVVGTTGEDYSYQLDGRKSKNAVSYHWEKLSGPFLLRNEDKAIADAIVPKNRVGETVYQLTITNKNGDQHTATAHVVAVRATADISGVASFDQGKTASLTGSANFTAKDGNALDFKWEVRSADGSQIVLLGSSKNLELSGLKKGKYAAQLAASTADGARTAKATHHFEVLGQHEDIIPPVAIVAGPSEADSGMIVTLDASASTGHAGRKLSYQWSVLPHVAFVADNARLSMTAPKLDRDMVYHITATVSDGELSNQKTHVLHVLKAVDDKAELCKGIPEWNRKSYRAGNEVQHNGRSFTAKWWTETHHIPGAPGWVGQPWKDNGLCK